MALRKQKSRKQQVAELATDYLKVKAVTKTAKGAGKGATKAAKGTAVYKVAKKTPVVKRIPVVARRRHRHARGGQDRPQPQRRRAVDRLTRAHGRSARARRGTQRSPEPGRSGPASRAPAA